MSKEKYPEKFAVKLPNELLEAVLKAASARYMSRSEYIRQAVVEKLRREELKSAA